MIGNDLQQRLQTKLDSDKRTRDWPIDVLVDGPVVHLTGSVRKPADRQLVESLIREEPGVSSVVNDIHIG